MHNVNTDALKQNVGLDGEWQTEEGQPQFRATILVPEPFVFAADFPPPMGGTGSAPNPLADCFWGGLACYAKTCAQEAARHGVQLRSVRARTEAEVDVSRALGVTDNATVGRIDWHLEVDADAPREKLEELKRIAAEHCPGVHCVRHPVKLTTHLVA